MTTKNNTADQANSGISTPDTMQLILEKNKAEKAQALAKATGMMTSTDFFLDNNENGLMKMETLRALSKDWNQSDIQLFKVTLQRLSEGEKIDYSPIGKGNSVPQMLNINIYSSRGTERLGLPLVDNVLKFIVLYRQQRFNCEFSFDEIAKLAKLY